MRQTHISMVFLAGPFVYKIKKPVSLAFLDFSTLEKRRHFCEEEVRLNRRLAPDVYLGVVPITRVGGELRFEGEGEPVEWAVKMARLPDEATLESRLMRGEVTPAQIEALGRRLAAFHEAAERGPHIAEFGRFDVVVRNLRENFRLSQAQVGVTVSAAVFERFRALTDSRLAEHRDLIEARARRGLPRDTHGDLHLDHLYLFPERPPPADLVIIDCIEFNERFRYTDPIADMAFPVMDLAFHGKRDFARVLADAYFQASRDEEGRILLALYTAYRAAVRGKVDGMKYFEKEVPADEKEKAMRGARAHWLLGLGELEMPASRPAMIIVCGLPGTGKSTLASALAATFGAQWLRSDVIRKELAGVPPQEKLPAQVDAGIYAEEWTERTYAELLRRAEECLFQGRRVIVDANFRREGQRERFVAAAAELCVPCVILHCLAGKEVVRERLSRRGGDASDADWTIYQNVAATWEEFGSQLGSLVKPVDCSVDAATSTARAMAALVECGLA